MIWKRQRTRATIDIETEVCLGQFEPEQLLQALIDEEWLTESEASEVKGRAGKSRKPTLAFPPEQAALVPNEASEDAWCEILRGRKAEALYLIERALGREWTGRLS